MSLSKNSRFNFGMFKGYTIGIVYAFSPGYIDWCIRTLDNFCIDDLFELITYGVVNQSLNWQYGASGLVEFIYGIDAFEYLDDLSRIAKLEPRLLFFDKSVVNMNYQKNQFLSEHLEVWKKSSLKCQECSGYAKFSTQIKILNPQRVIDIVQLDILCNNWIIFELENKISVLIHTGELAAIHNDGVANNQPLVFDSDGRVREGIKVGIRDDLKIGVKDGNIIVG